MMCNHWSSVKNASTIRTWRFSTKLDISFSHSVSQGPVVGKKYLVNGVLNTQLAELICPPSQNSIQQCSINLLNDISLSSCPMMRVRCYKKRNNCHKPNNFVYSQRYKKYGQICTGTGTNKSPCAGGCFYCKEYANHATLKYDGHKCMTAGKEATGQEQQ